MACVGVMVVVVVAD